MFSLLCWLVIYENTENSLADLNKKRNGISKNY